MTLRVYTSECTPDGGFMLPVESRLRSADCELGTPTGL